MPKYAARTDTNQQDVISWYEGLGWQVIVTSGAGNGFPDLVAVRQFDEYWSIILVEVKRDKSAQYTAKQKQFNAKYPDLAVRVENEYDVLSSIGDALRVIGRL